MTRVTVGRKREPVRHAVAKHEKGGIEMVETYLPPGSARRTAAEVGGAVIVALVAAAALGVGPAALAGAAGYLVYRDVHRGRRTVA